MNLRLIRLSERIDQSTFLKITMGMKILFSEKADSKTVRTKASSQKRIDYFEEVRNLRFWSIF